MTQNRPTDSRQPGSARWGACRQVLPAAATFRLLVLALVLATSILPTPARAEGGLEVGDVRTDNYPRVIMRFNASQEDGLPVSNLKPGQLKIYENGVLQEQVDFYSLRENSPELWVTLVVDVSGSMNDDDRLNQAKAAAKTFVSRLRPKDRTAIVTFSDKVILQQQPTGDISTLNRAIGVLEAKGPTRMYDGLARGVAESLRGRAAARRAIVLLSDGEDTDSQTSLEAAVAPAVNAGIPIYTIGLGTAIKPEVLQDISSRTKARYYAAPRSTDLEYVFRLLSGKLSTAFEAWWQSTTVVPSGSTIHGKMVIDIPGQPVLESEFSYVMPVFFRPIPREEVHSNEPLREVQVDGAGWHLPDWWPFEAALLAAVGVYLAYYGLVMRTTRSMLQQRLRDHVSSYLSHRGLFLQSKAVQRQTLRPLILRLAKLCHRMMPTRVLDDLRYRMVLAGRPSGWHFSQFLAMKLILAGGLAFAGYLMTAATSPAPISLVAIIGSLGMLGYYLPHPWLGSQIRARQKSIQRALPDALDIITVGVGAGLSFDGAVLEMVQKSDNALTHELANYLAELRMGRSRREALQGLQARTQVEDLQGLIASLVQAEELGMSLGETLVIQADQMRLKRRQRAEELAHKATIKMMFPMIGLIFPALFIVIIGPAVPGMLEFLNGGG